MTPPDFLIIANPTSGAQGAPVLATRVVDLLKQRGRTVELRTTAKQGDAKTWAADAAQAGFPVVVACGGDGTLQEIASSIESTPTALGILPGGRCNDFARALKLYKSDSPETLTQILLTGQRRPMDVGTVHDRKFLTVATLGFDSHVSRFVETRKLWLKGPLAYMYGVLRVLPGFRCPMLRLSGDFGVHEGRMLLAATGNAPFYGGALQIAPGATMNDGHFDICTVKEISRIAILGFLIRVLRGSHTTHPAVTMLKTQRLHVETPEGPQYICADGETLGQTPCTFEIKPGALTILAPLHEPTEVFTPEALAQKARAEALAKCQAPK